MAAFGAEKSHKTTTFSLNVRIVRIVHYCSQCSGVRIVRIVRFVQGGITWLTR